MNSYRLWSRTQRLWKNLFSKHLLLTNTVSCGALLALGDAIQQGIEWKLHKKKQTYDWSRAGRMFTVGLIEGPPHHYWYVWLDRALPGRSLRTIGLKIVADEIVAAPLFAYLFFMGMGFLEGKTLQKCWSEFKLKFPAVYLFDWIIWPPTQIINFKWVPQEYRVVYVNVITVVWDIFLSYMKHFDEGIDHGVVEELESKYLEMHSLDKPEDEVKLRSFDSPSSS
ncbi:unnamed protein product [Cyprideis torosa]|uniref:Uncharacterized protein n=1 Tax=Cyprideis torosa TaxID=163714 RepID=A0A7R8WEW5_9CRUS|nr:unnamed protein product [Cyprideis torosa]CAG0896276.1 unnamed protein product [Cyprideis torosa]